MRIIDSIYYILRKFKDNEMYRRVIPSQTVSFAANETKTLTFSNVAPSGCRPVGVINIAKMGGGNADLIPSAFYTSATVNTATITLKNLSNAARNDITVQITVLVLPL